MQIGEFEAVQVGDFEAVQVGDFGAWQVARLAEELSASRAPRDARIVPHMNERESKRLPVTVYMSQVIGSRLL